MAKPRYQKTIVPLTDGKVEIYAGVRVSRALQEFLKLDMYQGASISDLLSAIYEQGKKDGALSVRKGFDQLMQTIPHNKPGRPSKKKKG